ncbi:MAG: hypothetical protein WA323_19910 [Candidatus Nitrosopolaris sp.]
MTAHFNKEKRSPDESIIDADLETGYANYHRSLGNDNSFFLGNSTWTIYNSTSGSTGTITFKEIDIHYNHNGWSYSIPHTTYTRILHGIIYEGWVDGVIVYFDAYFDLCPGTHVERGLKVCTILTPTETPLSPNYLEFKD